MKEKMFDAQGFPEQIEKNREKNSADEQGENNAQVAEQENKIESVEDGLKKIKLKIENILNKMPAPEKLAETYANQFSGPYRDTRRALRTSGAMAVRASLETYLWEMNNRFKEDILLEGVIEKIVDYSWISGIGGTWKETHDWLNDELDELKKMVDVTRELKQNEFQK